MSFAWFVVGTLAGAGGMYALAKEGKWKPNPTGQREYRVNNKERELWVDNDEGLHRWWKSSRLSKREFIRQNKAEIDEAILGVVHGTKRPHHLIYG